MSASCLKVVTKLSQSCVKVVPKLSQSFVHIVPKWFQVLSIRAPYCLYSSEVAPSGRQIDSSGAQLLSVKIPSSAQILFMQFPSGVKSSQSCPNSQVVQKCFSSSSQVVPWSLFLLICDRKVFCVSACNPSALAKMTLYWVVD